MSGWRLRRLGRTQQLLAVACLGLAAVVALELAEGPAAPPPVVAGAGPPAAAPPSAADSFSMPPRSAYDEILARPLFSDTRRPSAFAAAAANAHPMFLLVGTVVSQRERSALIRHGRPAHVDHVVEGQSVDGWTVDSIRPDRVVFANAGARIAVTAKGETAVTAHHEPTGHSSGSLSSVPSPPSKD